MRKILDFLGIALIYLGAATVVILLMQYFYHSSEFFRSLFDGGTFTASAAAAQTAEQQGNIAAATAHLSFYILIFALLLQVFAFITALKIFIGIAQSKESDRIRAARMKNADIFLDLPLYFGLFGTVSSFIVMSFNPQISRLIAYSSTLVGILFSVILRLALQFPLAERLNSKPEASKE